MLNLEEKSIDEIVTILEESDIEKDFTSLGFAHLYLKLFNSKTHVILPATEVRIANAIKSKLVNYIQAINAPAQQTYSLIAQSAFILSMIGHNDDAIEIIEQSILNRLSKQTIYRELSALLNGQSSYRRIAAQKISKRYFQVQLDKAVNWQEMFYPSENYKGFKQFLEDYFTPLKEAGVLTGYDKYDFAKDLRKGVFYHISLDAESVKMINEDIANAPTESAKEAIRNTVKHYLIDQFVINDFEALMDLNINIRYEQIHLSKESVKQISERGFNKYLHYLRKNGSDIRSSFIEDINPLVFSKEVFNEQKSWLIDRAWFRRLAVMRFSSKQIQELLS